MIGANIGKCAGFGKGETKGATSGQVSTVKCPVVTGDRMGDLCLILPDYGTSHCDREGSRAEVSTADDDHRRRWLQLVSMGGCGSERRSCRRAGCGSLSGRRVRG